MMVTADPVIDWSAGDRIVRDSYRIFSVGDIARLDHVMWDVLAVIPGGFMHVRPRSADVT